MGSKPRIQAFSYAGQWQREPIVITQLSLVSCLCSLVSCRLWHREPIWITQLSRVSVTDSIQSSQCGLLNCLCHSLLSLVSATHSCLLPLPLTLVSCLCHWLLSLVSATDSIQSSQCGLLNCLCSLASATDSSLLSCVSATHFYPK